MHNCYAAIAVGTYESELTESELGHLRCCARTALKCRLCYTPKATICAGNHTIVSKQLIYECITCGTGAMSVKHHGTT